jgi:hypothetical protein
MSPKRNHSLLILLTRNNLTTMTTQSQTPSMSHWELLEQRKTEALTSFFPKTFPTLPRPQQWKMIADHLRWIADNVLSPTGHRRDDPEFDFDTEDGFNNYTCDLVWDAVGSIANTILYMVGLRETGDYGPDMDNFVPEVDIWNAFDEFERGDERQSVRYAWLELIAYLIETGEFDNDFSPMVVYNHFREDTEGVTIPEPAQ